MSIDETYQPRHRFDKLIAVWHALLERVRGILPPRWLMLLAGIGCLTYSQYMMEQRFGQGQLSPVVEQWNTFYRLEMVNLGNVLAALPYFAVGTRSMCLGRTALGLDRKVCELVSSVVRTPCDKMGKANASPVGCHRLDDLSSDSTRKA